MAKKPEFVALDLGALVAGAKFRNVLPSVVHTYGSVQNWCVTK